MSRIKRLTLDHRIVFTPAPEQQAEFDLSASLYSVDEGAAGSFTIVRSVRTDQTLTIDWVIDGASVTPLSNTETLTPGQASKNIDITAALIDQNEVGSVTISNPQYVSGVASAPILGSQVTATFNVINLDPDVITHKHPRLAGVRYGLRDYALDDADGVAARQHIADRDIAFIGMYKDGPWDNTWRTDYLMRVDVGIDLKARNPNLIIGDYVNVMESSETSESGIKCLSETGPTGNGGTWTPNDWFGRSYQGNLLTVASNMTNPTAYVTLDSQGRDYVDWRYEVDFGGVILADHAAGIGVGQDGMNLFQDNMFRRARHDTQDLNRDGTQDGGRTDPFVEEFSAWRAGIAKVFELAIADYPQHLNFGNISEWFAESITPVILPDEYVGLLHGGEVQNNITNNPFCGILQDGTRNPSGFGSGELAFACYTYAMDNCIAPKYVATSFVFTIVGDPYDPQSGTDFQHYRWVHTMTCLDDGYFMYEENTNYNNLVNMDEMGLIHTATTGLSGPDWLGDAIDPPQRTPIHGSLYIRRFTGGAVIHNMSLTQDQFCIVGVDIPSGYFRINGVQDSSVNTGAALTSFTLNPQDGLFVRLP